MMLVIIAFFSIVVPSFFSLSNATNIIRQGTVLALAAFGQTFVILVAGIDLSIGAIMGLTSSTLALLMLQGYPVVTAVLLALLVALACGAINGFARQLHWPRSFRCDFRHAEHGLGCRSHDHPGADDISDSQAICAF
jgi:ribose/xylose/arabinose/galactoside ABC-type transport system permease subunit